VWLGEYIIAHCPDAIFGLLQGDHDTASFSASALAFRALEKDKSKHTIDRFKQIENRAREYSQDVSTLHAYISDRQENLNKVLQQMISKGESFYNTKTFEIILVEYNITQRSRTVLVKDKKVVEVGLFDDERYFMLSDDTFHSDIGKAKKVFRDPLLYYFVQFLREYGPSRIKQCNKCSKFFVPKADREAAYCSSQCRLAYHNKKRIESGENREYKERKRREGAKESYYG